MDFLTFIQDHSDTIDLLLIILIFPLLRGIRKAFQVYSEHDSSLMENIAANSTSIATSNQSIARNTRAIAQIRTEMRASQLRHERMEDAILFLASDDKIKEAISILRGHKKEDKSAL